MTSSYVTSLVLRLPKTGYKHAQLFYLPLVLCYVQCVG